MGPVGGDPHEGNNDHKGIKAKEDTNSEILVRPNFNLPENIGRNANKYVC